MHTIPCFIQKNTPELVKKLKDLGLKVYLDCKPNYLLACHGVVTGIWSETVLEDLKSNGVIDCGDNEDLFRAIAALRDDSDVNQWFVMDVEIYTDFPQGSWFMATDRSGGRHVGIQIEPLYCHKATVEELIEHFGGDNVGSK